VRRLGAGQSRGTTHTLNDRRLARARTHTHTHARKRTHAHTCLAHTTAPAAESADGGAAAATRLVGEPERRSLTTSFLGDGADSAVAHPAPASVGSIGRCTRGAKPKGFFCSVPTHVYLEARRLARIGTISYLLVVCLLWLLCVFFCRVFSVHSSTFY